MAKQGGADGRQVRTRRMQQQQHQNSELPQHSCAKNKNIDSGPQLLEKCLRLSTVWSLSLSLFSTLTLFSTVVSTSSSSSTSFRLASIIESWNLHSSTICWSSKPDGRHHSLMIKRTQKGQHGIIQPLTDSAAGARNSRKRVPTESTPTFLTDALFLHIHFASLSGSLFCSCIPLSAIRA